MKKRLQQLSNHCRRLAIFCLLAVVRLYQWFISPLIGPRCRFYPSCSDYCQQALVEHGPVKGLYLAGKRICRCHPGHPGGFDPVPKKSCSHG